MSFLVNGDPLSFQEWPKIARFSRDIVITEKIDGTNAQIIIYDDGTEIAAASRTTLITPEKDNYGFARWVQDNKFDLLNLGPGRHFGEWWGSGIQRKYGMECKLFSLFNTSRWTSRFNLDGRVDSTETHTCIEVPSCQVVPVIYSGPFLTEAIEESLDLLITKGSVASQYTFYDPEGVVVFHSASGAMFKKTIGDDGAKSR